MKWKKWLENWDMTELKINAGFLDLTWQPRKADKDAAWEMYIELLTRVSTQTISPDQGDEEAAIKSIYSLFGLTRSIIKFHGRNCQEFTKIAIVVLNQVVRPFSSKWHKALVLGNLNDPDVCIVFWQELVELQSTLRKYTKMLSEMAGVEDLTSLELVRP